MVQFWTRLESEYFTLNPAPDSHNCINVKMFWTGEGMTGGKVVFPKLKGKGAEIKALMPGLVWLWDQYRTPGNPQHDQTLVLLQCSVHLDVLLDLHKDEDVLPPADAHQFRNSGFALNSIMNSLQTFYRSLGFALFNITPKNHYLALHLSSTS